MAREVWRNYVMFLLSRVKPIEDQTLERARAAVRWLIRAQDATLDGGVSYGYFPGSPSGNWMPSYPETTGYIIPSLLEFGRKEQHDDLMARALRMAAWEVQIQMASGAVQGGMVCRAENQTPSSFNTGMVLAGWVAAYRLTRCQTYLEAGRRAANFLVQDLSPDGYFRTNGSFMAPTGTKVFHCLSAWSLYQFGQETQEEQYQKAATEIVEAALRRQQPNGWFANNCLTKPHAPLTHTIGYTLQGTLEVGSLAGRVDFIDAVRRTIDHVIQRISPEGFLPGRFSNDWKPASLSSCLTGSAQLSIVCFRLYELTGKKEYRAAGDRLVNFLKALQVIDSPVDDINGALAGSFPILGEYQCGGYPNWAAKYLLDALVLQNRVSRPI